MNTVTNLQSETERLVGLVNEADPFDYDYGEMLPRQLAAIDERFQDRVQKIKLLQNRAETGGITAVRSMRDIVPLLFAHTAYKSYPEGWLMEQKWDRLGRWLDTVSTYRVPKLDTSGVKGLDDWLALLEQNQHYVSCSSGTTGKCAMMNGSAVDLAFCGASLLQGVLWSGLKPGDGRRMISLGQVAATPRNRATGRPMAEAFSTPGRPTFYPDVPPITIGGITDMVMMRKRIAEGSASPSEIARFEAEAKKREQAIEDSIEQCADEIIASRDVPLHIMGLYGPLFQVSERIRSKGYGGKDFRENSAFISGGLKRVQLPDDYKEYIAETLNLTPERTVQAYGMQECNTTAFKCSAGRYHMAPWVMLLLLDESGETLVEPPAQGQAEGRAAFFDLSLDGRWGGVISGDKLRARWDRCACGMRSPSIDPDIQRYADMASGDKIACSGTIDAYVRGVA